ncbi:MAG: PIN domain-containing protein [Deltaproteobacteria bacterium]|nr:PIN domain-containing protein [Deltaproteobacteria bacterium]
MSIPHSLYLDTNYLLFLVAYEGGERQAPASRCKKFYDKCIAAKSMLFTSILGFEEAIFIHYYKKGLAEDCQSHFVTIGNRKSDFRIKNFIRNYPGALADIHATHVSKILGFRQLLRNWHIPLMFPEPPIKGFNVSDALARYASVLMKGFADLEPMDALHVAIARLSGADAIVTTDSSFQQVPTIRSINPVKDPF